MAAGEPGSARRDGLGFRSRISLNNLTIKRLSYIDGDMATDDTVSTYIASLEARVAGDAIGARLKEISVLTRGIGKKIGETLGVNPTDMAALEQLLMNGPLTPGQLAAHLKVTTAAATQIVDRLERAGHVTRERKAGDRRKVFVVPAHESVGRAFQELAPMLDGLDGVIAGLGQDERQVVERFLDQVIGVYRTVAGFSPPASPPH
ncbi:MarR family winged helix-turn-helix transcriptional regulator [Caulobacter sp. LARHSG274]